MAERTGVALRPLSDSSANRTPATTEIGRPDVAPKRTSRLSRGGAPGRRRKEICCTARSRKEDRQDAEDDKQDEKSETECVPIECQARIGIDRSHWAERGERGQQEGHGNGEKRAEEHRRYDAEQLITEHRESAGAEGAQDTSLF